MTGTDYRICTTCIMDTTDPEITFDEAGVCNHCHFYDNYARRWMFGENREELLEKLIANVRRVGAGKEYDCVIGVSGGVDSSYVAYVTREMGLRPLAVHVDNGWDSELAVKNIEQILDVLNVELYTKVLDWEEFRDLQLAFLRSSTPDTEIPTDFAVVASLHRAAAKNGIRYVLMGHNYKTEAILPRRWAHGHRDWRYISSIYRMFGHGRLRQFPRYNLWDMFHYYPVCRIQKYNLIDYLDFDRNAAVETLKSKLSWRPYPGKHCESVFTRFFQGYILPKKFNIDKRRAHMSSLICSGQLTRDQALVDIEAPPYDEIMIEEDREYVIKKLGITETQFDEIMALPPKSFYDYPSYESNVAHRMLYGFLQRLPKIPEFVGRKLARRKASV